ncbi:helix-turn-helix domain-containing protein [Pseudonocardia sp. Ae406_Ps2]|uniref:winged helix-turn-helix transcriptional regulator n=1 Tax=Pseudonocardia sp. Ae406_Ps2 TaxID=1885033 RepID=UPI001BAEF285
MVDAQGRPGQYGHFCRLGVVVRLPVIRALEVCPVEVAVSVLGGTWKLTLVKHLLDGPRRFNELGRLVPSANTKTLTRQLRELESDGVVHRTVFAEVPPRVEYRLTRLGRTLEPVVEVMDRWGGGVRRGLHPGCGGEGPRTPHPGHRPDRPCCRVRTVGKPLMPPSTGAVAANLDTDGRSCLCATVNPTQALAAMRCRLPGRSRRRPRGRSRPSGSSRCR